MTPSAPVLAPPLITCPTSAGSVHPLYEVIKVITSQLTIELLILRKNDQVCKCV